MGNGAQFNIIALRLEQLIQMRAIQIFTINILSPQNLSQIDFFMHSNFVIVLWKLKLEQSYLCMFQ